MQQQENTSPTMSGIETTKRFARAGTARVSGFESPPSVRRADEDRRRRHRERAIASWLRSLVRNA